MGSLNISVGAGFENDRRDLGVLAAQALSSMACADGSARYLIFECLAERTLAKQVLAHSPESQIRLARSHLESSRALCKKHRIRVVTNLGGIDPIGVANGLKEIFGKDCVVAAVTGDELPVTAADLISVIAWQPEHFDHLVRCVTVEHCRDVFSNRKISAINRYVLPKLQAMNFVIDGALDGGVNCSLYQDRHGKTLSSFLLDSLIDAPD